MSNEEFEAELDKLRSDNRKLTDALAHLAGTQNATTAAVIGLLTVIGGTSPVREAIHTEIERFHASELGRSQVEETLRSFGEAADLIRAAMDVPPRQ